MRTSQKGSIGTLQRLIDFASLSKLVCVRFGACSAALRFARLGSVNFIPLGFPEKWETAKSRNPDHQKLITLSRASSASLWMKLD